MTDYGLIVDVTTTALGDQVVGAHAAGVSTLLLDDIVAFSESGGVVNSPLGLLTYTGVNDATKTMTLAAPLPAGGLADGDRLILWEQNSGGEVTETIARVQLEGDDDGDPLEVVVPQSLRAMLPEGLRLTGEWVELALRGDEWQIVDVPGKNPVLNSKAIEDPDTGEEPWGSDGLPPASSPTPTLIPAIGAIIVRVLMLDNHDPVFYDVYLSTSSSVPIDPANLAGTMQGSLLFVRTLPATGVALVPGTTYYCKVVARDADGSASPSPTVSGSVATSLDALMQIKSTNVTEDMVSSPTLQSGIVNTVILNAATITATQAWIDAIESKSLTAEVVQTANSPNTGIKIGAAYSGLKAYNGTNETLSIDQNTGYLTAKVVRTGSSGQRVELRDGQYASQAGWAEIDLHTGRANASAATILAEDLGGAGIEMRITGVKFGGGVDPAQIKFRQPDSSQSLLSLDGRGQLLGGATYVSFLGVGVGGNSSIFSVFSDSIQLNGPVTAPSINVGGRTIGSFDFGSNSSATINGSGRSTISHGLGTTPVTVLTTNQGGNGRTYQVVAKGTNDFTTEARDATGNLLTSGTVDLSWVAISNL